MTRPKNESHYPRRRIIRSLLRGLIHVTFAALTDLHINGRENLPEKGPLIVAGNHFSYIDPVAAVRVASWPMEFIAGAVAAGAPSTVSWLPSVWGVYKVQRGDISTHALRASEAVLAQGGVLGVFPEGGTWANVLRPPRPGTAFLAARTGARILPIGIDGLIDVFPSLKEGERARVTVNIGQPFGPFSLSGRGRERRHRLEEIGHEIMRHIAELIPPERRGHYSDDPAIREAARGTEVWPWADASESDFKVGEHLRAKHRQRKRSD